MGMVPFKVSSSCHCVMKFYIQITVKMPTMFIVKSYHHLYLHLLFCIVYVL